MRLLSVLLLFYQCLQAIVFFFVYLYVTVLKVLIYQHNLVGHDAPRAIASGFHRFPHSDYYVFAIGLNVRLNVRQEVKREVKATMSGKDVAQATLNFVVVMVVRNFPK